MVSKDALIIPLGHAELPNGWTWKRLDQVMGEVVDCPHSTPRLTEAGPFLARTQDVRTGTFDLENAAHVSVQTYNDRIARGEPKAGDLLFSREGTYFGTCALVPEDIQVCLGQRMVLIRSIPTSDSAYVKYWINSPTMASFIAGQKDGSVAERINMPWIRALPIAVPPLSIQRQITAILSAFDHKIELNRRMNRTLEQMARALFKSWFVDFDPVRAKMRGEKPEGMDIETVAMFPERLVEIEGREVPEGWTCQPIKNLCEAVQNGSTPKRLHDAFWTNGTINWFKTGELTDSFLFASEEKITGQGLRGSSAKLWPAGTVLIAIYAAPTVGRLGILTEPSTSNQACSALIPRYEIGSFYIWHTLFEARAWLNTISTGAAQQNISKAIVENIPALVPTDTIIRIFNSQVETYWSMQKSIQLESNRLIQLRDTLLPRLLAGEVDVSRWRV